MTKELRVDPEAEAEMSHAIDRYEREREGLGAKFWEELRQALQSLATPGPECSPVIGLPRELGVRRKLLTRFPYAIVFLELETSIRVLSVMHGHRQPAYWRRRI
jgi:toxin ParE1/3/4